MKRRRRRRKEEGDSWRQSFSRGRQRSNVNTPISTSMTPCHHLAEKVLIWTLLNLTATSAAMWADVVIKRTAIKAIRSNQTTKSQTQCHVPVTRFTFFSISRSICLSFKCVYYHQCTNVWMFVSWLHTVELSHVSATRVRGNVAVVQRKKGNATARRSDLWPRTAACCVLPYRDFDNKLIVAVSDRSKSRCMLPLQSLYRHWRTTPYVQYIYSKCTVLSGDTTLWPVHRWYCNVILYLHI